MVTVSYLSKCAAGHVVMNEPGATEELPFFCARCRDPLIVDVRREPRTYVLIDPGEAVQLWANGRLQEVVPAQDMGEVCDTLVRFAEAWLGPRVGTDVVEVFKSDPLWSRLFLN